MKVLLTGTSGFLAHHTPLVLLARYGAENVVSAFCITTRAYGLKRTIDWYAEVYESNAPDLWL